MVSGTETLAVYPLGLFWLEVRHLLHRWVFTHKQLMGLGCGWFGGQVKALGSCYGIRGLGGHISLLVWECQCTLSQQIQLLQMAEHRKSIFQTIFCHWCLF